MATFTVHLSEERAETLRELAAQYNITPEEYIVRALEEELNISATGKGADELDEKFDAVVEDLLVKRRWLYEQLAKGPGAE